MPERMTWDDALRRMRAGEPLDDILDEKHAADRERLRSFLADFVPRGADALKGYDASMRDHDSGVYGARMAWHSISPAQRRTLLFLAPGRVLVRCAWSHNFYDAVAAADRFSTIAKAARLDTVRNLARRELLAWDGGAFQPEARAVLTERGTFVVAHGRMGGAHGV